MTEGALTLKRQFDTTMKTLTPACPDPAMDMRHCSYAHRYGIHSWTDLRLIPTNVQAIYSHHELPDECLTKLINVLGTFQHLTTFRLCGTGMVRLEPLISIIPSLPKLIDLTLSHNKITDITALCDLLKKNSQLQRLDIRTNPIRCEKLSHLYDSLVDNKKLKYLKTQNPAAVIFHANSCIIHRL